MKNAWIGFLNVGVMIFLPLVGSPTVGSSGPAPKSQTELISLSNSGQPANGSSSSLSLSADARFVAFASAASDLVPGDTNGVDDIFVRDRQTGVTERVSLSSGGTQSDGPSQNPSISADGRLVVFESYATNLVPDDSNGASDIFVRDRWTGKTARVSLASDGSQADGGSYNAVISGDGRFVAYSSTAANLVTADTNGLPDIFLRDLQTNTTTLVSVASSGSQANDVSDLAAITPDGRYVAFTSFATDLVGGDTNGVSDIFLRDTRLSTTERVSQFSNDIQGTADCSTPAISADGRYVAFASPDLDNPDPSLSGLLAIYVHDRQSDVTVRVSVASDGALANGSSFNPSLSADGHVVVFSSDAWNLVNSDTNGSSDVYAHNLITGETTLISLAADGGQANGASDHPQVSADGRAIGFRSTATNLVGQAIANPSTQASLENIYLRISGSLP